MAIFRYPDPTPVLPYLHGFSVKKKPTGTSSIFEAASGKQTRVLTQAFPVWEFDLTYELLATQTQNQLLDLDIDFQHIDRINYERILVVFLACKGRYGRFFFQDPSDYSRKEQNIGTANGSRTKFRLVRSISSGDLEYIEPVGGIDLSITPIVKVGNAIHLTGWTILPDLQTIEFDSAPFGIVTISYQYFYYCEFLDDLEDFEEFMRNFHTLQSLKFRSTKDCDKDAPNPWFLGY